MLAFFQDIYDFMRSAWVLWLMIIFCILVARAYWPSRKAKLETFGRIPLEDDCRGDR